MSRTFILTGGKLLFTLIAVFTAVAPFVADWNSTHIYNPAWPPHAKFHNAQTMASALLLALATLYFVWGRLDRKRMLAPAAIAAGLYWASQALAFLFPGVAWTDPNLLQAGQSLTDFPMQLTLDFVMFQLIAAACWLVRHGQGGDRPGTGQQG
jgi:hypothetical protein